MRFESPWAFLLLFIIPLLLMRRGGAPAAALRFSWVAGALKAQGSLRGRLVWIPAFLRYLALVLLVTALARPQRGTEQVRDINEGTAIMMVVDHSGSMQAEMDYGGGSMSRLEVVKEVFQEFVHGDGRGLAGRPSDLIGMVAFARYADTLCPLTLAHGALDYFLKSLKIVTQKEEDGTAIGDGLALAAARLRTAAETIAKQNGREEGGYEIKSKAIILLTDGRHNIGRRTPAQAAALAKEWGIKIYAIGVGGQAGLMGRGGIFGGLMLPLEEGVDKRTLQLLADQTGGKFWMAEDGDAMRGIYREIDQLERSRVEALRYLDYQEQFLHLALWAVALLVLEALLGATVFRKIP